MQEKLRKKLRNYFQIKKNQINFKLLAQYLLLLRLKKDIPEQLTIMIGQINNSKKKKKNNTRKS